MTVIALTGGIGSGKSEVAAIMSSMGVPVYDSDSRTKALYDSCLELVTALETALGLPLRLPDGSFDRAGLGRIIFSDDKARETVEAIVYPFVMEDFSRWKEDFPEAQAVAIESAVILSKPIFDGVYDAVIIVDAPVDVRVERASRRDKASTAVIAARVAAQQQAISRPDVPTAVINNDSDLPSLREKVKDCLASFLPE